MILPSYVTYQLAESRVEPFNCLGNNRLGHRRVVNIPTAAGANLRTLRLPVVPPIVRNIATLAVAKNSQVI